jgi:carboxymethylenebutenolidase
MNQYHFPFFCVCALILATVIAGCTGSLPATPSQGLTPLTGYQTSVTAEGKTYPAYIAAPAVYGKHPAIVLLHSFNGLEPGYREMVDRMATDGFVVIAPEWQTFSQRAGDPEAEAVIRSAVQALQARPDVDSSRLGLTGFCAGGRFTMLFLPRMKEFKAGVAWYGFPDSTGNTNTTTPVSHISELTAPILIIHGSRDQPSPIGSIYNYSRTLDAADKYFELKVYQGEPHGFMIANGTLVRKDAAENAYQEMITFFRRKM